MRYRRKCWLHHPWILVDTCNLLIGHPEKSIKHKSTVRRHFKKTKCQNMHPLLQMKCVNERKRREGSEAEALTMQAE